MNRSTRQHVEDILREAEGGLRDPRGIDPRNSDKALWILIAMRFYGKDETVRLDEVYDLPSQDSIKRRRAEFNAQHKYLPTDPEVIAARGLEKDAWEEDLGYPVPASMPSRQTSYTDTMLCCSRVMQKMLGAMRCGKCGKVKGVSKLL